MISAKRGAGLFCLLQGARSASQSDQTVISLIESKNRSMLKVAE